MSIPANFLSTVIINENLQLKNIVDVLVIGETDSPSTTRELQYFSTQDD
jgi:hypothetical protein